MKRFTAFVICLVGGGLINLSALADDNWKKLPARTAAIINKFCLDCHGQDASAGLDLRPLTATEWASSADARNAVLEKIGRRLRSRQMPPIEADRPSDEDYQATLTELEAYLDQAAEQRLQPGRTDAIRRLNRTEYGNAIRDLLHLDINAEDLLPADQEGHGFDNVTLGELPPLLLNRYVSAAEKIARQALGGRERSPGGTTVRIPADRSQDAHVAGLPLGTRGGQVFTHHFLQSGEYEIQLRLMRDRDEKIEGLTEPCEVDVLLDSGRVHRFTVQPPKKGSEWANDFTHLDAHLKKRFFVTAGPHDIGATFPQKSAALSEIYRQPFEASFNRHRHPRKAPAIYEISIVGPFDPQGPGDTRSRRRVYGDYIIRSDRTGIPQTARLILKRLLRRAYRRDVSGEDLTIPMRFFEQRFRSDGFEAGMEAALASVLINPHFLLRAESPPDDVEVGAVYQISDTELASRLSFFLWSSIPDDELLELASQQQLHEPHVLKAQVQRMLADPRSQSLVSNFASQWLYLRNLESLKPDMRLFTDFDDNLRRAMRRETELLFGSVVSNDSSVLKLIQTDTTFLNERLAKHYGIPHVVGSHFRPVKISANSHRGGILRHASVLSVTSYATRTSPTIRGHWILKNILGTAPPPPPPNVPALQEKTAQLNLTVRERLAEHRANPACASCHNLMDPVGFALENFDAVGRWRLFEGEQSIDSSGALPDGQQIHSVDALEQGILKHPENFVGTLTEKLLTFALGRGIESFDGPAVRRIVKRAAASEYQFSSLIEGIALSTPFLMRTAE